MGRFPVYLLLCLVVTKYCCCYKDFLPDLNGVVRPNDPYIYIGNNLTLTCNLTKYDEVTYNSQYLSFSRRNDEPVPSKYISIVSTRSIILRFPITSPEDEAHYLCKLNRSANRPELIGSQFVRVEYEPKPVTEISCRVYNWENMTCTWDLGVKFVHPNTIEVKLVWVVQKDQFDCPHQTNTSCSWWKNDGPDSFMSDTTYFVGVSIENKLTSVYYPEKTKAITVDTTQIVEPAPVKRMRAEKNSTCITVYWQHEKTRRDKVYKVNFKHEMARHWETKEVGDAENLTLCGLRPNSLYYVQVSCLPKLFSGQEKGFWSKPAELSVKTDEDVPIKAPEIHPGSYTESPCQQLCKKVMLYWKPLSMIESNGNISYYRIDYHDISDSNHWETVRAEKTQHQLMLLSNHGYRIQIRAATVKGTSNVVSEVFIPPETQKPSIPDHIVETDSQSQNTRGSIHWKPIEQQSSRYWQHLISYTVFWCRAYKIDQRCQESIQSTDVSLTDTQLDLHIDQFETYLFGVAVNALTSSGEVISSGFKWNTCTYVDNTRPEVAPTNIRLSLYQPNAGLSIKWDKISCEETNAFITFYKVNVCPSDKEHNCSGSVVTYKVAREQSDIQIYDLNEGSRYKIWINAASNAGLSEDSESLYSIVVDRRLNSGEIVGIVVASLFMVIVFLFAFILCSRRVYVTVKQRYFDPVPIEIPHSLPPLPPIPMPPRQKSPDSDESDGIYEKIVDGPPSPGSSTESTTGVDAPLISHKLKFSTLKNHIYGYKKDRHRNSSDSGRDSMSHSADTLLMRLHPSHLRRKKMKKSNKSESDSGVMVNGRGQVCIYTHSSQSEDGTCQDNYIDDQMEDEKNVNDKIHDTVNPYSCVDIVDTLDSKSEQLFPNLSEKVSNNTSHCNGSTLSLPPGFCKTPIIVCKSLNSRAQSADNELDYDSRRLSSMKETKEFESSDLCSEDGTLDSCGDMEHETSESLSSRGPDSLNSRSSYDSQVPDMSSYIKVTDDTHVELGSDLNSYFVEQINCGCHRNNTTVPIIVGDGYVTEAAMRPPVQQYCQCQRNSISNGQSCNDQTSFGEFTSDVRPGSQVYNLPPHFFGSMSSVPVDPDRTTEL
ncbi:Cytokine receptor-like factor 1 [Mactra antiquata]